MNRLEQTPTLLVFTLGPECESARRRLLPPSLRAAEVLLHQNNLDAALRAGRRAGFRLVVAAPRTLDLPAAIVQIRQQGCSFAERFRSTIDEIQKSCRGAPLAVHWLEDHPRGVVLGPARDGGFYLLAACEPLDLALESARWRRRDTLRSLQETLRHEGRPVKLLDELSDLDHPADLESWLSRGGPSRSRGWLARLLKSLLSRWRRPLIQAAQPLPRAGWVSTVCGRAPPL